MKKPAKKSAKKKLPAKDKVQPPLPGAEQDDKIPEIHTAALTYKQCQQDFSQAGEDLEESRIRLVDRMKEHKKVHYQHGNVEVDLRTGKDRVKVKIVNAEENG